MPSEREIACKTLLEYRQSGVWPDLYLKKGLEPLDRAQAALATTITYGVIQNCALLDYYIAHFSSVRLNKISPYVLENIRVALYQILFLDRVPDSAAVNEAVKVISKGGNKRATGFANGLLRAIARQKEELPEIKCRTKSETLSVKYSHPHWMVKKFMMLFGEDGAEALLAADNSPADAIVRVNTLKCTDESFLSLCSDLGVSEPVRAEGIPHAYVISDLAPLLKNRAFSDGWFYVQDTASQLAVSVLAPQKGDRLLDICAAPGGKSLLAAQYMENSGEIVSNDIYPHKAALIADNAHRYGVEIIKTSCKDGSLYSPDSEGIFDKIICDVPCSGLGIIRKKPDIRDKKQEEIKSLPKIQRSILESAASCLKPGGRLIYTTCTILPEENERVFTAFLESHPDFKSVPFELLGQKCDSGYITLLPHVHGTDGFFISLMERRA